MKQTVEVTREDIEHGVRGNKFCCPISLAVRRTLRCNCVEVQCNTLIIHDAGPRRHLLPPTAQTFVNWFDHSEPVKPFTFEIEVPDV